MSSAKCCSFLLGLNEFEWTTTGRFLAAETVQARWQNVYLGILAVVAQIQEPARFDTLGQKSI